MDAKHIASLVEIADNLFFYKTSLHLDEVEKDILEQILVGKKFDDIQAGKSTNDTIKKYWIPKLWERLSLAFEKKIRKTNVLGELQNLHKEQRRIIVCKLSINRRDILTKNTLVKGLSRFQGKKISCLKSNNSNPMLNHQNTCSVCSSSLTPKEQQLTTSTDAGEQKVEDGATVQTHDWSSSSYQVAAPKSPVRTNSASDRRTYMKSGLPLLLALGVYGVWYALSWLGNWYGTKSHLAGKLPQAQIAYDWVLDINPWSAEAHYNLGAVYEDQQNYQQAQLQYQRAIELGLFAAYNNQARLYLLQEKSDPAIALLQAGLPLARNQEPRIKYSFLKNRGWARLQQGRLEEAQVELTQAIVLEQERSAAHCLLAQVLERRNEKQQALQHWEDCLAYTYLPRTPEEDIWTRLAQQRLKSSFGELNK